MKRQVELIQVFRQAVPQLHQPMLNKLSNATPVVKSQGLRMGDTGRARRLDALGPREKVGHRRDALDCDFCIELRGNPLAVDSRSSRIVFETENYALLVDIAPIAIGHMLVISKTHHLNMATACCENGAELRELIGVIAPIYKRAFGALTLVEHGSISEQIGLSACITHAHIHLLPFADELDAFYLNDFAEHRRPIVARSAGHDGAKPYILYCSSRHTSVVQLAARAPYKHYARSLAGRLAGTPSEMWDWAVVPQHDNFRRTMTMAACIRDAISWVDERHAKVGRRRVSKGDCL